MARAINSASVEDQEIHRHNEEAMERLLDALAVEADRRETAKTYGEMTVRTVWRNGRLEEFRVVPEQIFRLTQ